ncbi:MAG TPA: DNA methyltransferase, partial [Candidatus Omnitrophota bacterium]|nr:DNA methyltransferase [Candidatus Omnitrophota bacterium]
DCRAPDVVGRLMDGQDAACVWTDPPYGVSYQAASGKHLAIRNDEKTGDELAGSLLISAFVQGMLHSLPAAAWYIWHAAEAAEAFRFAIAAAGLQVLQTIVWTKNNHVQGWADYHWAHEPCFYACRQGCRPTWHAGRDQTTAWRLAVDTSAEISAALGTGLELQDGAGNSLFLSPRPPGRTVRSFRLQEGQSMRVQSDSARADAWQVSRDHQVAHPTQKPVELALRAIRNSTAPGAVVYDPFAGSGACILAAEQSGRLARCCELEPVHCDAIVQRWERMTGKTATRT